ncbi:MAG: transposase [Patescibacteria group bacterium]
MPRRPRKNIISPNTIYHIVCRGNAEKRIFRRSRDYQMLLKIIEKTKKNYPFYFFTYNFLPNHYHLEIETKTIPISKIMHQINNAYVKYFRRNYKGSGHIFQGRFFSNVVNKDSYLREVTRYIDLNAVRAGLARDPKKYKWSSFAIYCQKDYQGKLIDRERFLKYISNDVETARKVYVDFVAKGLKSKNKSVNSLGKKMD